VEEEFFKILVTAIGEIGVENTLAIWEEMVWLKRRRNNKIRPYAAYCEEKNTG